MRLTWWSALQPSTRGHVLAIVAAAAMVLAALAFNSVVLGLVAGGYAALALDGGVKYLLEQLSTKHEHAGGTGG